MGRVPEWTFFQRRHTNGQLAYEYVSTSLIIREMKIKTTLISHLTLVRMSIIKKKKKKVLVSMWRKENSGIQLMEMLIGTTIMEYSMKVPQKIKNRIYIS